MFINPYKKLNHNAIKVIGLISITIIVAIWSLITGFDLVSSNKLPSPLQVMHAFGYLAFSGNESMLLNATIASLTRVIVATLIVIVIGIPLGVLMGASPIMNSALSPLIDPFRSAPIAALLPIFVMWFGIGEQMKITFLVVCAIVYMIPLVRDAMLAVPYSYWEMMKDLGGTDLECIMKGVLPMAMPRIFDGITICFSVVFTYICIAEYVNADSGLGYLIQSARRFSAMDQVFAGIGTIIALAMLTNYIMSTLRKQLYSWEQA